jgi:hypothetical protein
VEKKEFDLRAFKKEIGIDEERLKLISQRTKAIRQRIWEQESFKASTIECYCLEVYDIETKSAVKLLKQFGLADQYNIDQYSGEFLERIK